MTWKFDINALKQAKEELDIQAPVRCIFGELRHHTLGIHYIRDGKHLIVINKKLDTAQLISEVLWHELAHAHQAEEYARATAKKLDDFHMFYLQENGPDGLSYLNNRMEAHARVLAQRNSHRLLVIKNGDVA